MTDPYPAAVSEVLARTIELCEIPAPPLQESARATCVEQWWESDGIGELSQDETGNVWGRLRDGSGPAVVVAAHLDTVFAADVAHGARPDGAGRLLGPGVGDDSVAVASLSSLRTLLPGSCGAPVWVLATVGEEGLGNLAGVTAALQRPRVEVGALIALEGNYLGRVNTVGVGSVRSRVVIDSPGGHAWEDADAPSAVHVAAAMIGELDRLRAGIAGRTSVNAGLVSGGESINSRALRCQFDLDLRSDDPELLDRLGAGLAAAVAAVPAGVRVELTDLGTRPAGRIDDAHPLVLASEQALREVDVPSRRTAASTDANAAYARGIPAVTLGITFGDRTHTEDEWIEILPIETGLRALVRTICLYTNARGRA